MKRKKQQHHWRRRIAWSALVLHLLVYAGVWFTALYRVPTIEGLTVLDLTNVSGYAQAIQNTILVALLWVPALLLHVGIHLTVMGRLRSVPDSTDERKAYRDGFGDGFNDAMRQMQSPRTASPEHPAALLDEDGELVTWEFQESEEKQKRTH